MKSIIYPALIVLILISISIADYTVYKNVSERQSVMQDEINICYANNMSLSDRLDANIMWSEEQLATKHDQIQDMEFTVAALSVDVKAVDTNTKTAFETLGGQLRVAFTGVAKDFETINEQLLMVYELLPPKEDI